MGQIKRVGGCRACFTVDAIAAVIETGRMSETQAGSGSGAKAEGGAGGKGDAGKLEPPPPGGSYAGIPRADFIEDVDAFMALPDNVESVEKVLKRLDEQHGKYKFMEFNLISKRRRLQQQIPDLSRSLEMIKMLRSQKDSIDSQFLLSEQVYVKAKIPPTQNVCLWLGANVMLEYTLEDAEALLTTNMGNANRNLGYVEHDLDYLRDQFTTTEVNMARVYNWDVTRRQSADKPKA